MICPECKNFSDELTSLYNGSYKTCPKCNEKFLYEENRIEQSQLAVKIEKTNSIFLEE